MRPLPIMQDATLSTSCSKVLLVQEPPTTAGSPPEVPDFHSFPSQKTNCRAITYVRKKAFSKDHKPPTLSVANVYNALVSRNWHVRDTPTHSLDLVFHEIFTLSDLVAALFHIHGWQTHPDHMAIDHTPVSFSLSPTHGSTRTFRGFNWKKTNWIEISRLLLSQVSLISEEDFNHLYHTWNANLTEICHIKGYLFHEFRASCIPKDTYHAARNAYLGAIRKATAEHWNGVYENTDPASLWNTVRKAFPKLAASIATINSTTPFEDKTTVLRRYLFPPPLPFTLHTPSMDMSGFTPVNNAEVQKAIGAIPLSSAPRDNIFSISVWKFESRKGHSPLDAVHLLLEKVTKASYQGLFSTALFLDIMGAFDKVLHGQLAEIMAECGFHPSLIDWIQSYLSGSSQLFKFNACHRVDLKISYVDNFCLLAISAFWAINALLLSNAGIEMQSEANGSGMHFDISKTKLFHFPYKKQLPPHSPEAPTVQIGLHTIINNIQQHWVSMFFESSL
ncbi:hypothetical protein L211DRAFT_853039 [Terfezia boudieri ATCC MYA-4762]|uniref:Uncharacterized protein n=1 Tax=Terfezia boudieri ATCC MYA-4762 TaxID=1051890 RepID=A0A3N4LNV0_9PEZI|nr:hypothetical protein L211DRAFT_853039 [Terfezia boudieri ATCC MYA-4762]